MSLKSFQKALQDAASICEDAATTTALTQQTRMGGNNTPAVIEVNLTQGLNVGQLETELRSQVSPTTSFTIEGDKLTVTTNNPFSAIKTLQLLGVPVSSKNIVNSDEIKKQFVPNIAM